MDPQHVHLVGSINFPTSEGAMSLAASRLGDALLRLPDGEPGPRRGWIFYQRPMFTHNRQLVPANAGDPGRPDILGARTVREGVTADEIEFPELGYAREAQSSYRWFAAAKADGRVAPRTRFQVSLPTPFGILMSAVLPDAIPLVEPAYERAMFREIDVIAAAIPHDQLAMQWDVCLEMLLYDGNAYPAPWHDAAFRARFARLTAAVPGDIDLGIHLCYGDYDGTHIVEPADATRMAGLANLITEASARPLQFVHMPIPIGWDDDRHYAPFADLRLGPETEVFLGLIHHRDGVEGAKRRCELASHHLAEFGVATECGIGRIHPPDEVEAISTSMPT